MDARPLIKWVNGILERDSLAPLTHVPPAGLATAMAGYHLRLTAHGRPYSLERQAGQHFLRSTPIPERLHPSFQHHWDTPTKESSRP